MNASTILPAHFRGVIRMDTHHRAAEKSAVRPEEGRRHAEGAFVHAHNGDTVRQASIERSPPGRGNPPRRDRQALCSPLLELAGFSTLKFVRVISRASR